MVSRTARKEDPIDHRVGLVIEKKIGDWVEAESEIAKVYARSGGSGQWGGGGLGCGSWHDATTKTP